MGLSIGYTELKRIEGRLIDILEENETLTTSIMNSLTGINNNVSEDELGLSATMNELANRFDTESKNCKQLAKEMQTMLVTMLNAANATTENVQQGLKSLGENLDNITF